MPLASFSRGNGDHQVLALHGFLGSGRNLSSLLRTWSAQRPDITVYAADLPGHGDSPPLPPRADLFAVASEVLGFADELSPAKPLSAVGHSIGGRVLLASLILAPHRFERVAILDIGPGPTAGVAEDLGTIFAHVLDAPERAPDRNAYRAFFLERGVSPALTDWLLLNLRRGELGLEWKIDREALKGFHDHSQATNLWEAAEKHPDKLTFIRGERSGFLTQNDCERLASLGVPTVVIPNAGHFVHVDALDAVVRRLTEFL